MKMSIVIPAHNESGRIGKTLDNYGAFFEQRKMETGLETELLVVLNGCIDNTLKVVQAAQKTFPSIRIMDLENAGKGLAITAGFKDALTRENNLIGFIDADMATRPKYFCELIDNIGDSDGIIASRYMKESKILPQRPRVKEWGRILVYNPLISLLFGIKYKDFQCGAKLFKRRVVETIAPHITLGQWAIDAELLYLNKKHNFSVKEIPTVWYDQDDSKFNLRAGLQMIGSLFKLRWAHWWKK